MEPPSAGKANGRARGAADGRRRAADGRARGAAVGRLRAADGRARGAAAGRRRAADGRAADGRAANGRDFARKGVPHIDAVALFSRMLAEGA